MDPNPDTWQVAAQRLANAGLTPQQVQVVWPKNARTGVGDFPGQAQALQGDLEAIARNLRIHSWGPYLWADGSNPRGDGFIWLPADMVGDCTHPSTAGSQKIANLMRDSFSSDATTVPWFLAAPPTAPTVAAVELGIIWRPAQP